MKMSVVVEENQIEGILNEGGYACDDFCITPYSGCPNMNLFKSENGFYVLDGEGYFTETLDDSKRIITKEKNYIEKEKNQKIYFTHDNHYWDDIKLTQNLSDDELAIVRQNNIVVWKNQKTNKGIFLIDNKKHGSIPARISNDELYLLFERGNDNNPESGLVPEDALDILSVYSKHPTKYSWSQSDKLWIHRNVHQQLQRSPKI